jgi:hypothetical protein
MLANEWLISFETNLQLKWSVKKEKAMLQCWLTRKNIKRTVRDIVNTWHARYSNHTTPTDVAMQTIVDRADAATSHFQNGYTASVRSSV